ncbi:transposase [Weeksella virosa]|uniref:transposase n=1 Tax=Weeksella virosa TaxID=1014 RepID=UPI0025546389|nr:transposase [Weeksella virosa]MDK7375351.1 transposase [Weeksella virosa]
MKYFLLLFFLFIANQSFAQTNEELKKEIQEIKSTIKTIQQDIDAIRTENISLKKTLAINKAILEQNEANNLYKIIKVKGNRAKKTIEITFLVESKDANKQLFVNDLSIIDLEGNEYKVNLFKSSSPFPKLAVNIPLKLNFSFNDIENEPDYLKLFRFQVTSTLQESRKEFRSNLEFRDLKVNWE